MDTEDIEGFAQAARARHLVRKYTDAALPDDIISKLSARADANNAAYSLAIKLMANDGHGIPAVVKIFRAHGVKNYFILAGDDAPDLGERLGYSAADLMLYAQTLGLNSWYIGATYNHGVSRYVNGKKAIGIVVVGYGQTAGVPHKSKSASEISKYEGSASGKGSQTAAPEWFTKGVEMALLAPTALNRQDFFITGEGNTVHIKAANTPYSGANLGLVRYHFELGAGKGNFEWA